MAPPDRRPRRFRQMERTPDRPGAIVRCLLIGVSLSLSLSRSAHVPPGRPLGPRAPPVAKSVRTHFREEKKKLFGFDRFGNERACIKKKNCDRGESWRTSAALFREKNLHLPGLLTRAPRADYLHREQRCQVDVTFATSPSPPGRPSPFFRDLGASRQRCPRKKEGQGKQSNDVT